MIFKDFKNISEETYQELENLGDKELDRLPKIKEEIKKVESD